jgi:hypothetical protein
MRKDEALCFLAACADEGVWRFARLQILARHLILAFVVAGLMASPLSGARTALGPLPRFLIITGTRTEGDVPSPLTEFLDLRTGFSRMAFRTGESEAQQGFDGVGWVAGNGITNSVDLPALIADALSRAWLDRAGWRQTGVPGTRRRLVPRGGSPLVLFFGAGGRIDHAVINDDDGPLTVTFSDWREIGSVGYPFRQEAVDATGQRTIIQAERIDPRASLGPHDLDRPASVSHAELAGEAPATVPIRFLGSSKSHILVRATVNGVPSLLIFDTGAANYLTTDAALKFAVHAIGGINLGGVGESSTTGGFATIDSIALGSAALRNETVIVGPSPFPKVNGKASEIDGAVGYEFLTAFITTIDYPGSTFTFASRGGGLRPGGVRVRFYSDGHSIYVPATIEGRTGMFRLDTGSGDTIAVFSDYAGKLGVRGGATIADGAGGIGGMVKEKPGTIGSFSLGGLTFRQLPVHLSQTKAGAFASRSLAGNLGAGVLQCYRLTFDYAGRSIWFAPKPTLPTCGRGANISSARR